MLSLVRMNTMKSEQALLNAIASLTIEGYVLTEQELELIKGRATGEITEEEFLKLAIQYAKGE